jgi:hypothetical protein
LHNANDVRRKSAMLLLNTNCLRQSLNNGDEIMRRAGGKYVKGARIGDEKNLPQLAELTVSNPEWLRERIFSALSELSYDERNEAQYEILYHLMNAGVSIGLSLFTLGIPAATPDQLSPSDLAKLVRFIRINKPEVIKAIEASLKELIYGQRQKAKRAKPVKKAA